MTRKVFALLIPAFLLVLAASAVAAEGDTTQDPERPDDAAWVEDCPPDMMCAASAPDEEQNESRGPEDCEACRYHQDEECIDCTTAPMPADNTTWGTDCPPGVFCMVNGDADDPDDAGWVECDGDVCAYDQPEDPVLEHEETKEASAWTGPVLLGVFGLMVVVLVASIRWK